MELLNKLTQIQSSKGTLIPHVPVIEPQHEEMRGQKAQPEYDDKGQHCYRYLAAGAHLEEAKGEERVTQSKLNEGGGFAVG